MEAGERIYRVSDGRIGTLIRWESSEEARVHFDGEVYQSKATEGGLIPRGAIEPLPYKE